MSIYNYLLVMPCSSSNSAGETIFPLGIAYLSACLKKEGFNVYTLNMNHCGDDIDRALSESIKKNKINVVMTGGLSAQYSIINRIIESAVSVEPDIVVVVGGGIVTGDPIPAMTALAKADFGIIGEGEVTVCELCRELEGGHDFAGVRGLIYKGTDGSYVVNEERPAIVNLDELPFPDYEGFGFEKHLPSSEADDMCSSVDMRRKVNSVYIIGSRSCPYRCTFCFHTVGNKYRQRSLDSIFEEIKYLVEKYKIKFIGIQDELFSSNRQRVVEFCRRIKPYGIGWWAQFRVDRVDRELVETVKDAGCQVIGFGLESADNRILKSMRKGITVEQIETALDIVYAAGIPFVGSFIFGDREETCESAFNTLEWWKLHTKYRIDLRLIMIYPGSELYFYALKTGKITDPVKYLKEGCPQINVSKMTDNELSELARALVAAPVENSIEFMRCNYVNGILHAACMSCGYENAYDNVVFFMGSYLSCVKCGQKHNITIPDVMLKSVGKNIKKILEKYGNIAIWAINYYINDMFSRLDILKSDDVYPIDTSHAKQGMLTGTRKICHPDIIREKDVKIVVIGVPSYKIQIETYVHHEYKNVQRVIDICDLTSDIFDI